MQVEGIHKSPLPGLSATGAELIYANEDASMIFAGRIIDTKTRTDLTSERWDTLNAVDFNTLPFDLALKVVRGDGSRKFVVFPIRCVPTAGCSSRKCKASTTSPFTPSSIRSNRFIRVPARRL